MKLHRLKLSYSFWDAVMSGEKTFELRENDRGFQKGDLITFQEVDEIGIKTTRTSENFVITYVLPGWGLKDNYVALAIRKNED